MTRPRAALLILLALLVPSGIGSPEPAFGAEQPDVVIIYIDDWSPQLRQLWSKASRTPALAKFVKHGTEFVNTSGSTPLCCPGLANLQTGRWSHNNGVTSNDPRRYDPDSALASRLQGQGYTTMYAGKFFVKLNKVAPTEPDVLRYAEGWDHFDLVWQRTSSKHAYYYHYRLWTREGTRAHGGRPQDHSTSVAARSLAKRIRKAPRDRPIFAQLSIFNGHKPNLPMPRFVGHKACRGVKGWSGPGYNEANVADKPAHVRALPRIRGKALDLRTRCEEAMSIDWATNHIRRALAATGRLRNTLLIFTADNGLMMGEHRVKALKRVPYATPVPLYMLWPAEMGGSRRRVKEPVSTVDLAPTICELAGCAMPNADGMSILPLVRGTKDRLDRRFIYEEFLHTVHPNPAWYGLRTTKAYDDRLWVYTEYKTGDRELYDLTADPHQLRNRAGQPAYADREADLRELLHDKVIGPDEVEWRS